MDPANGVRTPQRMSGPLQTVSGLMQMPDTTCRGPQTVCWSPDTGSGHRPDTICSGPDAVLRNPLCSGSRDVTGVCWATILRRCAIAEPLLNWVSMSHAQGEQSDVDRSRLEGSSGHDETRSLASYGIMPSDALCASLAPLLGGRLAGTKKKVPPCMVHPLP
eukprot:gene15118-biopygen18679